MIQIISDKGEEYSYDEGKGIIYKDNYVVPSTLAEPIFSGNGKKNQPPQFSGIYFKQTGSILTMSGRYETLTDPNTIV